MSENIIGKAFIKEVLNVPVKDGNVFVYKVENDDDNLLFDNFYIATFDDTSNEVVWGIGYDIKDALEDAEKKWDRTEPDYNNPFREAIEMLKEKNNNVLENY